MEPTDLQYASVQSSANAQRSTPTACHAAEVPSMREIFEQYSAFLWRALRRLGVAERDADDACQEVFVVVHRRLGSFDRDGSLKAWLYGICLRVASDYRKKAHVRREMPTEHPFGNGHEASEDATQERNIRAKQALELLDEALANLDEDKRAAFVLYELESLEMNDVAQAMGCSLKTAYARLYAAREYVERVFERAEKHGGGWP